MTTNQKQPVTRMPSQLWIRRFFCVALLRAASTTFIAAQEPNSKITPTPGPMLSDGMLTLETPDFKLVLVKSSQTIAALNPKSATDFDFTPGDLLVARSQNGYFHIGDITLRLRSRNSDEWKNYSTATNRAPVKALPSSAQVLA